RKTRRTVLAANVACVETWLRPSTREKADGFRSSATGRFRENNQRRDWLSGDWTLKALERHYRHCEKDRQHNHASQPRFGVPGECEQAFIIKEIIGENRYRQKMPGKSAPPGGDR